MARLNQYSNLSPKQAANMKYNTARNNLLLVIVFTIVNIILAATGSDTYFLFSAHIPYYITFLGALLTGKMPDYYYTEMEGFEPMGDGVLVALTILAVVITLMYLLFWFCSKKRSGWLIAALVFFSLDTLMMLINFGISLSSLFDILFHAMVIYYLVIGIKAHFDAKNIPDEEPIVAEYTEPLTEGSAQGEGTEGASAPESSKPLRYADDVKHRVLISAEVLGHNVVYRRVKRVNELVIDGMVYDEVEMLLEVAHTLNATIDGHHIAAGYDGRLYSLIELDGELVAKKVRLY